MTDRTWRGIGLIPHSGWRLSPPTGNTTRSTGSGRGYSRRGVRAVPLGRGVAGSDRRECAAFGTSCTRVIRSARQWSSKRCAAYYLYRRLR